MESPNRGQSRRTPSSRVRVEARLAKMERVITLSRLVRSKCTNFKQTSRVTSILLVAAMVLMSTLVDSRLIHIYHNLSNEEPNTSEQQQQFSANNGGRETSSSSSSLSSAAAAATSGNLSSTNPSLNARTIISRALESAREDEQTSAPTGEAKSTIEFRSPVKRIIDLIGHHHHHQPVIVVADSSSSSAGDEMIKPANGDGSATSTSAQISAALSSQQQQQPIDQQQQQQQQHWTIVDTSHLGLLAPFTGSNQQAQQQQQQLAAQQQQLVQSIVPGGQQQQQPQQYYTFSPAAQLGDTMLSPFGIIQSALTAASSGGGGGDGSGATFGFPSQLLPAGFNPYQQPQQQQQQQVTQSSQNYQQQQTPADQQSVQPVFLSSYVPELPSTSLMQTPAGTYAIGPNGPTQLNSVASAQQMQQQQQQQQHSRQPNSIQSQIKSPSTDENDAKRSGEENESGERSTGEENGDRHSDAPEQDSSIESSADADQSAPSDSGSSNYEDKYDSDHDGDHQPTSRSTKFRAEPSGQVINGLVNVGLNDDCLQCICRASSGCDHLLRCITRGAEEKYCGPFQLTEEYWQKAGSPGDQANNFISFEDCANDADCAVETVTNYMKKYFRDCDGDDNITCMDYARLHRLKPNECDQTDRLLNDYDAYWAKFQRCAEGYNRTRNGDDEDI